jgi:ABC-type uncharacterized transport system substrate-binding protein
MNSRRQNRDEEVHASRIPSWSRKAGDKSKLHRVISGAEDDRNGRGRRPAKQLGLLHELVPAITRVGLLVNPNHANADAVVKDLTTAAAGIGLQVDVVHASDRLGIERAFATLVNNRAEELVVAADPFFISRRLQLATLATRHLIPAV